MMSPRNLANLFAARALVSMSDTLSSLRLNVVHAEHVLLGQFAHVELATSDVTSHAFHDGVVSQRLRALAVRKERAWFGLLPTEVRERVAKVLDALRRERCRHGLGLVGGQGDAVLPLAAPINQAAVDEDEPAARRAHDVPRGIHHATHHAGAIAKDAEDGAVAGVLVVLESHGAAVLEVREAVQSGVPQVDVGE